ncbi:MAG: signal peptide peptidase SppA [Chitinophagaceae bacterium]
MRSFFKIFFASFLSLAVFSLVVFFILIALAGSLSQKEKERIDAKSVLVLDLGQRFSEQEQEDPVGVLLGEDKIPGLYDVVRLIKHAKEDKNISGIYIVANNNRNGFAASDELRNAILDFKTSRKFVVAHGDMISQNAYFVASAADRIYANPVGYVDWSGFSSELFFIKGTLEKLKIEPQIFYAGKFKSATEPLRAEKMTPENKEQTIEWLGDLYKYFLVRTAEARKMDTATLHRLAFTGTIQQPKDALQNRLIDGLKYDDEIKNEFKKNLGLGKYDKLNLVSTTTYADAVNFKATGSGRIAVIYAEGNIVDGEGDRQSIGGDRFRKMIRKVRLDKSIKAIVLRVNSGGGSALASENIWRELELAKQDKPVVVSFGDVAASGGYYIGCGADSIFASRNTITGSIGVFGIIPNMQGFFKDKLGVTFDGVKTAPYADAGAVYRPLTETEKGFIQQSIDQIYLQFKQRVAQGRKKDLAYVDSVAQGRVWSGDDAVRLGLVDKVGGLQDAINSAARLAKLDDYRLREYPQQESWINSLLNKNKQTPQAIIRKEIGEESYKVYQQLQQVQQMVGSAQARLPFDFFIR